MLENELLLADRLARFSQRAQGGDLVAAREARLDACALVRFYGWTDDTVAAWLAAQ